MILQVLVRAYEALAADGRLDKPGWLEAKVSWSLELDEDGRLKRIYPVGQPDEKGKRTVRAMKLPEMVKRASGVAANFLCDNAMYMLGVDSKGKKARAGMLFCLCGAASAAAGRRGFLDGAGNLPVLSAVGREERGDASAACAHTGRVEGRR